MTPPLAIRKRRRYRKKVIKTANIPQKATSWAETSAKMKKMDPIAHAIAVILDDMDSRWGSLPDPTDGRPVKG